MLTPGDLQLEAAKLLQAWSIWLIGVSTALVTAGSFLTTSAKVRLPVRDIRLVGFALGATIISAVLLVGALPAVVQKINVETMPRTEVFFGSAPGIYGYLYLGFIPLWVLVGLQRFSFLFAIIVILRAISRSLTAQDPPPPQSE